MGYVVVREAAPPEMIQAVVDAIWAFQEMAPANSDTWYRHPERENGMIELNGSGMVEMYHHPALWAIRQDPRLHRRAPPKPRRSTRLPSDRVARSAAASLPTCTARAVCT